MSGKIDTFTHLSIFLALFRLSRLEVSYLRCHQVYSSHEMLNSVLISYKFWLFHLIVINQFTYCMKFLRIIQLVHSIRNNVLTATCHNASFFLLKDLSRFLFKLFGSNSLYYPLRKLISISKHENFLNCVWEIVLYDQSRIANNITSPFLPSLNFRIVF